MLLFKKKEPWQIAAARWCVENSTQGFSEPQLVEWIVKNCKVDSIHAQRFFQEEIYLSPGTSRGRAAAAGLWMPTLDLVAKVTDYDELKEARVNSKRAFFFALLSNVIALTTLYLTYTV